MWTTTLALTRLGWCSISHVFCLETVAALGWLDPIRPSVDDGFGWSPQHRRPA